MLPILTLVRHFPFCYMETASKRTSFSLLVTMLIGLPCTVGMFIFADIDLYKAPFTLGKAPKVSNTDDTVPAEAETDKNSDSDAQ